MSDINDFLEMFNNGELDVIKYFNDYDTWFSVLKKRGLMGEIDPKNAVDSETWQNEYLLWLYDNDKEKYYKWVQELLNDIDVDPNTKKVFWIGQRDDLSELFCDGHRYDLSQDTIKSILSGENDWEPYWDTTDNVYRDVIEELDKNNIEHLKEVVVSQLSGQKLTPETDVMETLAENQGHPDYCEINNENVVAIIDDEETMKELLDNELSDLKSDLYSVHSNAYNSAYESDVWDEIWSELSKYFVGDGEFVYVKHPYKKDTQIEKFKIQINDFEGLINDYLYNNKGYGNSGTLEYHGSFLGSVKADKDCLSARVPDYPDFQKVDKNINAFFRDFI